MFCKSISLKYKKQIGDNLSINVPSSKSISNRLLVIRDLSNNYGEIEDISSSEDTQMLNNFIELSANKINNTFFCKNSGAVVRFLLALLSTKEGKWIIYADKRMQNRPLLPLIDILNRLGGDIRITSKEKIFPITIYGQKLVSKEIITLNNNLTSQIISALLLISGKIGNGLTLRIPHNQVSMPYIDMTIYLLNRFGANIQTKDNLLVCSEGGYKFNNIRVEKDYSCASFFYLYVAVGKLRKLRIKSLQTSILQGDYICVELFRQLGVQTIFDSEGAILGYDEKLARKNKKLEFDLQSFPDLFCPLVVASYISGKETFIRNLSSLKVKESDRLENMIRELNKLGKRCYRQQDDLFIQSIYDNNLQTNKITNNNSLLNKENIEILETSQANMQIKNLYIHSLTPFFHTYEDHRIAMSLSAIAFVCKEIAIENPTCVNKSFTDFWLQANKFFDIN